LHGHIDFRPRRRFSRRLAGQASEPVEVPNDLASRMAVGQEAREPWRRKAQLFDLSVVEFADDDRASAAEAFQRRRRQPVSLFRTIGLSGRRNDITPGVSETALRRVTDTIVDVLKGIA
jgi:hypothetical protein